VDEKAEKEMLRLLRAILGRVNWLAYEQMDSPLDVLKQDSPGFRMGGTEAYKEAMKEAEEQQEELKRQLVAPDLRKPDDKFG